MPPSTLLSWLRTTSFAAAMLLSVAPAALAQAGHAVSPGPLSKAHAALDGAGKCQSCHGPDRKIAPDRCLSCHQPVADRIRAKRGVHRAVSGAGSDCHVEHGGADADLRPLDPADFDHAGETGFALTGRHVSVAKNCASCHTSRSYLTASPTCASCHAPVLGRGRHETLVPPPKIGLRFAMAKLVGRTHELETLGMWIKSGGRLMTLTGAPGVGKTRLAREFVKRFAATGDALACDLQVRVVG